jgi:hypothetical protein
VGGVHENLPISEFQHKFLVDGNLVALRQNADDVTVLVLIVSLKPRQAELGHVLLVKPIDFGRVVQGVLVDVLKNIRLGDTIAYLSKMHLRDWGYVDQIRWFIVSGILVVGLAIREVRVGWVVVADVGVVRIHVRHEKQKWDNVQYIGSIGRTYRSLLLKKKSSSWVLEKSIEDIVIDGGEVDRGGCL